jgi:hypothetical protein
MVGRLSAHDDIPSGDRNECAQAAHAPPGMASGGIDATDVIHIRRIIESEHFTA